jgi:hypothetical protein
VGGKGKGGVYWLIGEGMSYITLSGMIQSGHTVIPSRDKAIKIE